MCQTEYTLVILELSKISPFLVSNNQFHHRSPISRLFVANFISFISFLPSFMPQFSNFSFSRQITSMIPVLTPGGRTPQGGPTSAGWVRMRNEPTVRVTCASDRRLDDSNRWPRLIGALARRSKARSTSARELYVALAHGLARLWHSASK